MNANTLLLNELFFLVGVFGAIVIPTYLHFRQRGKQRIVDQATAEAGRTYQNLARPGEQRADAVLADMHATMTTLSHGFTDVLVRLSFIEGYVRAQLDLRTVDAEAKREFLNGHTAQIVD